MRRALDQVTTASLGALRSYTAGFAPTTWSGDIPRRSRISSERSGRTAPSRWRTCSSRTRFRPSAARRDGVEADAALTTAFRLRGRLPERERYNVEGGYYIVGPDDRAQGDSGARHAVELDSTNFDAANSLAVTLAALARQRLRVAAYRQSLKYDSADGTILSQPRAARLSKWASTPSVDSMLGAFRPPRAFLSRLDRIRYTDFWHRRHYDSAEQVARVGADTGRPSPRGECARRAGVDRRLARPAARGRTPERTVECGQGDGARRHRQPLSGGDVPGVTGRPGPQ